MITLAFKATLAMAIALLLVAALRQARASARHLVLAALFAFLLVLPAAERFAPRWDIAVERASVRPIVAAMTTTATTPEGRAEARPTFTFTWFHVYAAGTTLLLGWLALGVLRLRRLEGAAEVWLDGTARMNEIANDANIRRPALVVLSRETQVPMTFGFRRSTIVLPQVAKHWSAGELTLALRHELEHVRREDWFLQLMARAACAIYWPVPFVWIAWRRFCLEAERACDDAVVGVADADVYAEQLVTLARNVRGFSTVPALGMAQRSRLGNRISAILDPLQRRGPHSRVATIATLAVTLALLVSVAPARLVAAVIDDEDSWRSPVGEALVESAESGDLGSVRRLLDAGADVNLRQHGDGTPLIGAARGGQLEMAEFLLDRGADANLACPGDGNPLIAAAARGSIEIVQLLLDRGAEIDAVVPGDENALIAACANGQGDVVKLLIRRNADVNARVLTPENEIRTPLSMARRNHHNGIERVLLEAGAKE